LIAMSASPETLALVDLGMGNLRSVERALLEAARAEGIALSVRVTGSPAEIAQASRVVVPGQGAFRDCARALEGDLGAAIRARIAAGAPYLGICLGLQALFDSSEEAPGARGLGVFSGAVKRLAPGVGPDGEPVKIPHMGWNELELLRRGAGPLAAFDLDPPHVYFVHSFHAVPEDLSLVAAVTTHGPHRITAAVQRGNVTATQFHPEKSQDAGLRLLAAFLSPRR
jgi:imidazole glycerol-phosphate synthase subunit HisH